MFAVYKYFGRNCDVAWVWPGRHDIAGASVLLLIYSGGGQGGHNPPLPVLCTPFSRLPYLFVPLSHDPPPPCSETDKTLTRLTQSIHVYMCHAISFMTYDVSDLERFPISMEVMLLFLSWVWIFVFWIFSHLKFCFKPWRRLNGSQETLLGSFLWLDDKQ